MKQSLVFLTILFIVSLASLLSGCDAILIENPGVALAVVETGDARDYAEQFSEERALYMTNAACAMSLILVVTLALLVRNIQLSRKIKEIANNDPLTGILNRRCFLESAAIQINRSLRLNSNCFIITFDVDHFKGINDTYGYLAGDKVLTEIATKVRSAIRPYDLFGRYGGDEFIIMMFDIDKPGAISAAERLRKDVCKEPIEFEGKQIPVSASFGIAFAAPINDIDSATKGASEALSQAKTEGRNRIVFPQ